MIKTLEQERASFCIEKIRKIKETNNKDNIQKFETNAKRLPSLVVSNGLIPTLAFYKSKKERKDVYKVVNEWLKKRNIIQSDALDDLVKTDFQTLRLATMEVLAIANWLKRIVEVEIKDEK
jgi:CRISPR-associated protein Cmr5